MLPPSFPDLYSVLGLAFNTGLSKERIQSAYIHRARRVHAGRGGVHKRFLKVRHAYDVLSDPDRRAEYDRRYETEQIRDADMSESATTTARGLQPLPSLTPTPTSRRIASATSAPDLSRAQPLNRSQPPTASHPDAIAEEYRRAIPAPDHHPETTHHHAQLLGPEDRDTFEPHIADFLDLAARDGLRMYHDAAFQGAVDQRCREVGQEMVEEMVPVTWDEVDRGIEDALRGWEEIRSGLLFGVVLRARPHLLGPRHSFMRAVYRVVAALGYFGESLRGLKERTASAGGEEGRRRRGLLDDFLILGALEAHQYTGRAMVDVLEGLEDMAGDLGSMDDGPLLAIMCRQMRHWPRVSDEF